MSKLILLRGNSGSGKTTIAKAIQKEWKDALYISQDDIRRNILNEKDGPNCEAKELILDLIQYAVSHSKNVILEGIFRVEWYEDMFDQIFSSFDCVCAYYFDLSFEETVKRHKTRKEAEEFGQDKLRLWFKEKNYLSIINEIKIGDTIDKDTIVKMILEQCS